MTSSEKEPTSVEREEAASEGLTRNLSHYLGSGATSHYVDQETGLPGKLEVL